MREAGKDEGVDRVTGPIGLGDGGKFWLDRRAEGPMVARVALGVGAGFGPEGALVDPARQQSDLVGWERFALGRHLGQVVARAVEHGDQGALIAVSGHDGGAVVALAT